MQDSANNNNKKITHIYFDFKYTGCFLCIGWFGSSLVQHQQSSINLKYKVSFRWVFHGTLYGTMDTRALFLLFRRSLSLNLYHSLR